MSYQSARSSTTFYDATHLPAGHGQEERTIPSAAHLWSTASLAQRLAVARKATFLIREQADQLARVVTRERGTSTHEARREVARSARIIAGSALGVASAIGSAGRDLGGEEPPAVVFCVQPWNCPYDQLARFIAPNLIEGKVVLVKHAGRIARAAAAFEKLWLDAGAPVGAYANLLISYD